MTVTLTASKTLTGTEAADSLTGGSTGYDFGQSEMNVDAPNNSLFLSHDGSALISNLAVNAQVMSGTYGGDFSAAADLTKLVGHGDGAASGGMQIDFRWDAATPFNSTYTKLKTGTGVSYVTRVPIPVEAMSRNNSGTEVDASAPVAGQIGTAGDATLGDRAHMTIRYQNPLGETQNGKRQVDLLYSFNFTS